MVKDQDSFGPLVNSLFEGI